MATRMPPPIPFRPGTRLPFGDGTLLLTEGAGRRAERVEDELRIPGDATVFAARVRRWLVAETVRQMGPETHLLAARIGKRVERVTAGDWRTRWGACGRGRISYNWRLLMAPDFVQRALIAHEVAHLAEPNHGPGFWRLATDLLGMSHQPARQWLAEHAPLLHSYGAEA